MPTIENVTKSATEIQNTEFFSKKEQEEFIKSSINYPLMISNDDGKIIEINEVTIINGANKNKGIPTEIYINTHTKNQKSIRHKYVLESLVSQ